MQLHVFSLRFTPDVSSGFWCLNPAASKYYSPFLQSICNGRAEELLCTLVSFWLRETPQMSYPIPSRNKREITLSCLPSTKDLGQHSFYFWPTLIFSVSGNYKDFTIAFLSFVNRPFANMKTPNLRKDKNVGSVP